MPVTGSVITNCSRCNCQLWIAPSGLEIVVRTGAKPICFKCVQAIDSSPEFVPPTPAQIAEIQRELGR
jgi:hypothetical protein